MEPPGQYPATCSHRRRAMHFRLLALALLPLLPALFAWIDHDGEDGGSSSATVLAGTLFALLLSLVLARGIRADFAATASPSRQPGAEGAVDTAYASEGGSTAVVATSEPSAATQDRLHADLAHELRTPLNAVLGYLALMRQVGLQPEQHRHAAIIEQAASHMLGLADDMLACAPPDTRCGSDEAGFELRATIRAVLAMLQPRADERGLALELYVDPAVPERLPGNPVRLRQVLLNLIGNSIRFTHEGKVAVSVGLDPVAGGDELAVRVTDTGIGLSETVREHIFEPFRQADASIAERYGGNGLGLAIALRLVRLGGGRLGVDSMPGQGSEFWFTYPFTAAASSPTDGRNRLPAESFHPNMNNSFPEHPSVEGVSSSDLKDLEILVVEDNAFLRELVSEVLTTAGAQVDAVTSAEEAVQQAQTTPYDVAILDLRLPDMHGAELMRILRALPGVRFPIIILSADVTAMGGNALQADACLPKPVSHARLLATIRELTGRSGSGPSLMPASAGGDMPAHLRPKLARNLRDLRFRIAAAMDGPDAELSALAHELRGVAGCFGLSELASAAASFERLLLNGGAPEAVARAFVALDACLGAAALASDSDAAVRNRPIALQ